MLTVKETGVRCSDYEIYGYVFEVFNDEEMVFSGRVDLEATNLQLQEVKEAIEVTINYFTHPYKLHLSNWVDRWEGEINSFLSEAIN